MLRKRSALWLCVIPVLLLAFWFGARGLDSRPIWGDEFRSIFDTKGTTPGHERSLPQIWQHVGQANPWHAPGYFLILDVWGNLTSWEPPVLRALSLLIGLLGIAMTYRLGRDWLSARVGLLAVVVLAVSAFYVRYLSELRVYTLIAFLSAFTVWTYIRIVNKRREPSRLLLLAFFLGVTATLYAHYLAAVTLVAIGLYHLFFVPGQRPWPLSRRARGADIRGGMPADRWWRVIGLMAAGALAFIPWVPFLLSGLSKAEKLDIRPLTTPAALWTFLYLFGNGFVALAALLAIAGIFFALRRSHFSVRQLVFLALASLVLLLGINQVLGVLAPGRPRYLMPLWPLFALLVAVGFAQLRRRPRILVAALSLWLIVGVWTNLFTTFTDGLDGASVTFPMQKVAAVLSPRAQKGDLIVNYLPDDNRDGSQYNLTAPYYYKPIGADSVRVSSDKSRERPKNETKLVEKLLNYDRLWIAYLPDNTPDSISVLRDDVSETFRHCGTLDERADVSIDLYIKSDKDCPDDLPGH